jgi:hypothetical protein
MKTALAVLARTCALAALHSHDHPTGARTMCAGPYLSSLTLYRQVVKLEVVSTSIHGQNYDL